MYKIRLYDKDNKYIGELWHPDNSTIDFKDLQAECRRQKLPVLRVKIVYAK